jgi:hypothetical protein
VDARIDKGCLLSELDWAPTRLRADLHAIEHRPVAVLRHWPAAISPSGWLESPTARPARNAYWRSAGHAFAIAVAYRRWLCRPQRQLELVAG